MGTKLSGRGYRAWHCQWHRVPCRGLLQFHNTSYGIEPLGSSPIFEHFVYRLRNENTVGFLFAQSHPGAAGRGLQEVSVGLCPVGLCPVGLCAWAAWLGSDGSSLQ